MQELTEQQRSVLRAIVVLSVIIGGMFGIKIDEGQLTTALSAAATIAAALWGIWKNCNITPEAAKAQQYLDALKKRG